MLVILGGGVSPDHIFGLRFWIPLFRVGITFIQCSSVIVYVAASLALLCRRYSRLQVYTFIPIRRLGAFRCL